jgi:hypothetical protein
MSSCCPPRPSSLLCTRRRLCHTITWHTTVAVQSSQPLNHPRPLRTGSGPAGEAYREHCSPSGANLQQKSLKRPAVKVGEGAMHQCMCIVALVRLPVGTGDGQRQPVPTYQHRKHRKHSIAYHILLVVAVALAVAVGVREPEPEPVPVQPTAHALHTPDAAPSGDEVAAPRRSLYFRPHCPHHTIH